MSKIQLLLDEKREWDDKELELIEPVCIACNTKVGVNKCNFTLCTPCWFDAEGYME